MTTARFYNLAALAACMCLLSCTADRVTLASLLGEMSDRESLTRYPRPEFVHKQFSSYNRASVSPEDPGWFANQDMSHFLGVEYNEGRREFIMLDADGPGVIVRWWMTFYKAQDGIIRIYIDHGGVPVIEGRPDSLLSGGLLAGYPFSASVQEGAPIGEEGRDYDHNLYFPIPFNSHCRVTYECDSLRRLFEYEGTPVPEGYWWPDVFYNIGCRFYTGNTEVESFTMESLENARALVEQTGRKLLSDGARSADRKSIAGGIPPGDSLVVDLDRKKRALDYLGIRFTAGDTGQALRATVLKIAFDGMETVWVPVGEFFGCGYTLSPHRTRMTRSDDRGNLESLWVMPYREHCRITFLNHGTSPVEISGETGTRPYRWRPESMYFGASWHEYDHIHSRDGNHSPFDLNIVDIRGKGVYAGDLVLLYNNSWMWWGEGDEKIFVDGEPFPSSFGTGTEDYYGYSFGREEAFSHPFLSQPVGTGNMRRGVVLNMRHRGLDAIPFQSSISANMELWHWDSVPVDYALTSYYYIMPPFSVNIRPDPEGVKRGVTR